MNKLYCLKFYIDGQFYCESCSYYENELRGDLQRYPEAYLVEKNDIHEIWRLDLCH